MLTVKPYGKAVKDKKAYSTLYWLEVQCEKYEIGLFEKNKRYTLEYHNVTLIEDATLYQACKYMYTVTHIKMYRYGVEKEISLFEVYKYSTYQTGSNKIEWTIDCYGYNTLSRTMTIAESNKLDRLLQDFFPETGSNQYCKSMTE